MTENEQIKRPIGGQTVCPFVKGSVENNSFYMEFHDEVTGQSEEQIEKTMIDSISTFTRLGPFADNEKLHKALLVIFPNLPEKQTKVLDIAHSSIKSEFVRNGLMVGQFHKNCDERGIYNPGFKVSVSPFPLIAIRHMAIHDIIFVKENSEWFHHYNLRFGHRFNEPKGIEDYNQHLIKYYDEAKRRFIR